MYVHYKNFYTSIIRLFQFSLTQKMHADHIRSEQGGRVPGPQGKTDLTHW